MDLRFPLLMSLALLTGCTTRAPKGGPRAPRSASTTVTVKGSDTMILLGQRLAEDFMAAHPDLTVQVTGGGSGTGIAALINGTTDIANASRAMKDVERAQVLARRGGEVVETRVALDGIAVFVHASNPLQSLSLEQLKRIYLGEIRNWRELGGRDEPLVIYGRENSSGTYAYFKERVLDEEDFAAEMQTLPGTAAVVNAVSQDRKAIGFGGIAYGGGIRHVAVRAEEGADAVLPTEEDVVSGRYPISRPLFMYTVGQPTGDVKVFIDYALSPVGQQVAAKVGYYPLPKAAAASETPARQPEPTVPDERGAAAVEPTPEVPQP